jgi:hypothetical protein
VRVAHLFVAADSQILALSDGRLSVLPVSGGFLKPVSSVSIRIRTHLLVLAVGWNFIQGVQFKCFLAQGASVEL